MPMSPHSSKAPHSDHSFSLSPPETHVISSIRWKPKAFIKPSRMRLSNQFLRGSFLEGFYWAEGGTIDHNGSLTASDHSLSGEEGWKAPFDRPSLACPPRAIRPAQENIFLSTNPSLPKQGRSTRVDHLSPVTDSPPMAYQLRGNPLRGNPLRRATLTLKHCLSSQYIFF